MARELRDNLIGTAAWAAIDPATRTFVASADAVYRQRRDDPNFDFAGAAIQYARAVEAELNSLIFPPVRTLLARAPYPERHARVDGRPIDLGDDVPHQTLGTLLTLLQHDDTLQRVRLRAHVPGDRVSNAMDPFRYGVG